MKKYKYISLFYCAVLLILEIIPYGAVCVFSGDNGEVLRQTYSYFSLVPYGYANFGPFFTALLTCLLSAMSIVRLITENKKVYNICSMISNIALFTAILPFLSGIKYITLIGVIIAFIILRVTAINIVLKRQ